MLEWFGIFHPTTIKVWWVALLVTSAVLKLVLIVRLQLARGYQFPLFCLYLLAATVAQLYPGDQRTWGLAIEIPLALALAGATWEACALGTYLSRGRRWERLRALAFGATVIFVAVLATPPPYANYPSSWYYLRMYSTIGAFGALVAAASFRMLHAKRLPYLLHCVLFTIWLGVLIWARRYTDNLEQRWIRRIVVEAAQVALLTAWLLRSPGYG